MALVAGFAALLIAAVVIVNLAAWINVRHEQRRRAYLGDKLYVEEQGSGKAVVFIAGLQASTHYWGVLPDVPGLRQIRVDLLGFGRSPWPSDSTYSLDEQLKWLRRTLVDRAATSDVTIIAHSFGCLIAANYAARHANEISRLILLGAPIFTSPDDARSRIREMSSVAALFSLNRIAAYEGCTLLCAARPIASALVSRVRPDLPAEVARDAMLHHWHSIHAAIEILLHVPLAASLDRQLGAKTTFVHGTEDRVTPRERIREVASAVGAQVIDVPGGHHAYRPVVIDMLNRTESTIGQPA